MCFSRLEVDVLRFSQDNLASSAGNSVLSYQTLEIKLWPSFKRNSFRTGESKTWEENERELPAKTRRVWTASCTRRTLSCTLLPIGDFALINQTWLIKVNLRCYPYSHRIRSFYIQTQFEKISIENIIFMLKIVTNMNETLIILHLQRMAGI